MRANWDGREGNGYLYVTLSRIGERRNRHLHALVLEAFVGPRPEGLVACHGSEGKSVNTVANLRWDTMTANMLDAVHRDGTHGEARKTHCKRNHPLLPPNLLAAGVEQGVRRCRACNTAHGRIRRQGSGDIQAESDAAYAALMAG